MPGRDPQVVREEGLGGGEDRGYCFPQGSLLHPLGGHAEGPKWLQEGVPALGQDWNRQFLSWCCFFFYFITK